MATIESLPPEIVVHIGDLCTWDVLPKHGKPGTTYARYHAAFARTSRHFHDILNPTLYRRNATHDAPLDSCLLWAALRNNLGTLKLAHRHGADLNTNGTRSANDFELEWSDIPGRLRFMASPLHIAVNQDSRQVVDYLLENGASPHIASRDYSSPTWYAANPYALDDVLKSLPNPYVLEDALKRLPNPYVPLLIHHGACLLADKVPALRLAAPAVAVVKQRTSPPEATIRECDGIINLLLGLRGADATMGALHYAVLNRPADVVKSILERPEADAAARDWQGMTALHHAASNTAVDAPEIARLLLQRGEVYAGAKDSNGMTALHHAARSGSLGVVKLLLPRSDVDVSGTDELEQKSVLHFAVEGGNVEIAKLILEQPLINASTQDHHGRTPFHLAARSGSHQLAKLLLGRAEVDTRALDRDGSNALHYSAMAPNNEPTQDLVRLLVVDGGVPLDARSSQETLLLHTLQAHPNAQSLQGTPLQHAIEQQNFRTALTLLSLGADTRIQRATNEEWTPLHWCLAFPRAELQEELTRKLIERGADVEAYVDNTDSDVNPGFGAAPDGPPLVYAAIRSKNVGCMRLLLDAGADVNPRAISDAYDFEELEEPADFTILASLLRHEWHRSRDYELSDNTKERISLLLERGARLDRGGIGRHATALQWAASNIGWRKEGIGFKVIQFLSEKATSKNIYRKNVIKTINKYEKYDDNDGRVIPPVLREFMDKVKPADGGETDYDESDDFASDSEDDESEEIE